VEDAVSRGVGWGGARRTGEGEEEGLEPNVTHVQKRRRLSHETEISCMRSVLSDG
jgi:hypothetical protein